LQLTATKHTLSATGSVYTRNWNSSISWWFFAQIASANKG
jgi:hypothetical protein